MVCSKDLRRPGDRMRTPEIARLKITSEPSSNEKNTNKWAISKRKINLSGFCCSEPVEWASLPCAVSFSRQRMSTLTSRRVWPGRRNVSWWPSMGSSATSALWISHTGAMRSFTTFIKWCSKKVMLSYLSMCLMFKIDVLLERHNPDAVVVVMAVDDFSSYLLAQSIIEKLSR